MKITVSSCDGYSDRNRPVISSEHNRKTLCGKTQNPKQELLKQGKKLFFSLGFPSMTSVAALFHKTLRDLFLPFLACVFHAFQRVPLFQVAGWKKR